jgi:hypothetical protein
MEVVISCGCLSALRAVGLCVFVKGLEDKGSAVRSGPGEEDKKCTAARSRTQVF